MLAHGIVITQQLVGAQHQLAKIHHAFALALVFIQLIDLDLLAAVRIMRRHIAGAHAFFFAVGNEVRQLLGRKALIVDIELLAKPLDGRELILRVENLECLRQPRQFVMCAQKAIAQSVERTNPHAAHIHGQHRRETRNHFLGGLIGKGYRQNAARRGIAVLEQPRNARGEHAGLARSGTGKNQRMALRQRDGGKLLVVEALQQWRVVRIHRTTCSRRLCGKHVLWKHPAIVESPGTCPRLREFRYWEYPHGCMRHSTDAGMPLESITGPKISWPGFLCPEHSLSVTQIPVARPSAQF